MEQTPEDMCIAHLTAAVFEIVQASMYLPRPGHSFEIKFDINFDQMIAEVQVNGHQIVFIPMAPETR